MPSAKRGRPSAGTSSDGAGSPGARARGRAERDSGGSARGWQERQVAAEREDAMRAEVARLRGDDEAVGGERSREARRQPEAQDLHVSGEDAESHDARLQVAAPDP